jgi:hypothetical protein
MGNVEEQNENLFLKTRVLLYDLMRRWKRQAPKFNMTIIMSWFHSRCATTCTISA